MVWFHRVCRDVTGVLEAIKKDGVDCRFAKESGLLGTGTYFAELISLALCYVTRVQFVFNLPHV